MRRCVTESIAASIDRANQKTIMTETELRIRYEAHGQGHVFAYFDSLSETEKIEFLTQLACIQVEQIRALLESASNDPAESSKSTIQPFNGAVACSSDVETMKQSRAIGMDSISQRKVAALVLAGGQGTRLGFSGPKGMYDIGLPSKRTLFELVSLRLLKLSKLASSTIPFYVMTSPWNHDKTRAYFEANDNFGLASVFFFQQGMLPCLTTEGKIILETAGQVAMAPDGNGGIYPALESSGALDDMEQRKIEYLHIFSSDNALVLPADPVFVGYCIHNNVECGNKSVWKSHAQEQVGVVAQRNGKPCIVEYSEITKNMAEFTTENGTLLLYGAGNICNHFYKVSFIRNSILPNMKNLYHLARKKIPHYNGTTTITLLQSHRRPKTMESSLKHLYLTFSFLPNVPFASWKWSDAKNLLPSRTSRATIVRIRRGL